MTGPTSLYQICREYLVACEQALALTPGGPIDRSYVSPGPPAWDCCEQLTVHAGGPSIGDTAPLQPPLQPGHRVVGTGTVNLITMTATILRPSPTLMADGEGWETPDPADMDAAAQNTCADVWTVWEHLKSLRRQGVLWPPPRELFIDPAVPLQTAGGCSGWQIQVRVSLDGFATV